MHRLTTKQRLSLIFGSYVFSFIVIIAIAVYYLMQTVVISELKSQSVLLANEIINNFLSIDGNKLMLDQKEESHIEEELAETNSSALLFDSSLNVLFGYGSFSFFNQTDTENAKNIIVFTRQISASNQVSTTTLIWRNQKMLLTAVPVSSKDNIFGILIIGKPVASITQLGNTIGIAFTVLAVFSFAGSVVLGNILVKNALKPLQHLARTINSISLESLRKANPLDGSQEDEIVQLVQKFNTMVERIEGMSQQQKDFISHASHELKTPIASIASSLELLSLDAPKYAKKIDEIRRTLFEMNALLDQLMQLSRLQNGIAPQPQNVFIEKAVSSVVSQLTCDISEKHMTVKTQIPPEMRISMPKEYVHVLFANIISNSIKYSFENTTIEISGIIQGNTQSVEITNYGIGMSEYEISHIFDKFYRSAEAKKQAKGSGIGLSIVSRICELYKIQITINSKKNISTTVSLTFPA
jgi:signal transduction histidine kinase